MDTNERGPFWLGDERVAKLVAESLHHHNGQVYDLVVFCIMPNHVHLVCTPLPKSKDSFYSLASILHSLKLYVARRANILLERNGDFWQHENYDHVIRDDDELCRIVEYVLNNPVSANLVKNRKDWKWSFSKYERAN